ncbi:hypothetical protein BDN67DRAFT_1003942 [Paxillus ammoniavirescens]|nr:hypothetical protein BDN67DRAFT_1003942 [Paxillus ammoniavirescens]
MGNWANLPLDDRRALAMSCYRPPSSLSDIYPECEQTQNSFVDNNREPEVVRPGERWALDPDTSVQSQPRSERRLQYNPKGSAWPIDKTESHKSKRGPWSHVQNVYLWNLGHKCTRLTEGKMSRRKLQPGLDSKKGFAPTFLKNQTRAGAFGKPTHIVKLSVDLPILEAYPVVFNPKHSLWMQYQLDRVGHERKMMLTMADAGSPYETLLVGNLTAEIRRG